MFYPTQEPHVPPRKKKNLVIVESPAKAKTISKYLGPDYEVAASKGHVRDLPKSKFGIDIEAGWVPTYSNLADRREVLNDLKKRADKAGAIYLAPDPDREGEAIAWHLKEALGLEDDRVRRVTFNEITKRAIQAAFENPKQIDLDRVRAQETRRFLDRVVGYQLSPLLRKKVSRGLSAGRVQSVAVRLIVEREREIQAFKPEEYWRVVAQLHAVARNGESPAAIKIKKQATAETKEDGEEPETAAAQQMPTLSPGAFLAELAQWKDEKFAVTTQEAAQAVLDELARSSFVVSRVEQKDRQESPPPPFTTSTLQQQASLRLHFAAERTMRIAQRLYEGVDMGADGSVALITYMRTDSVRVSADAQNAARDMIRQKYGEAYVPEKPNVYRSAKQAQEGHEAIRPTDLSWTPEKTAKFLPPEQQRLYALIYNRFVASQMKPALFAVTNVEITAGVGLLKAQGKVLKFDGYRKVYTYGKQEDALLPPLAERQPLRCSELTASQHFTQPPPRYNEASLVKTLEKEGIGRPSTYATIISKIQQRGYVEQQHRRFYATKLGMLVTDLLVEHFPKIMDVKFTGHMEDELDQIENSHLEWKGVLNEFYEPFSQALKVAETKMPTVKGIESDEMCPLCQSPLVTRWSKRGEFLGCSKYPECRYIKPREGEDGTAPELTEHKCPECGKPMLKRVGKRGPFLSCTGYPDCKTTMNLDAAGNAVPSAVKTEHKCEKCGSPMVLRQGKRGPFLACTGYPKCRNAKDVDAEGNPLEVPDTGVKCQKCGEPMVIRRGPRGPFLGCTAYPRCRNAKPVPAQLKELANKLFPPPPKRHVPQLEISETCPKCNGPMKLRAGRGGNYFLGCSKYPKCRGTREPSAELLEKLAQTTDA